MKKTTKTPATHSPSELSEVESKIRESLKKLASPSTHGERNLNELPFTGGEWEFELAKWAKEAPTGGFIIKSNGKDICGLNVKTNCNVIPRDHEWYREDVNATPEEVEANAKIISESKNMYLALKDLIESLIHTGLDNGKYYENAKEILDRIQKH